MPKKMLKLHDFGRRSGHKTAKLSIGAMRLPKDVDEAVTLVRHAIDKGLRYIDISRGYGEAEWIIGLALRDGYRKKVLVSTKWSPWTRKIRADDDATSDCVRRRIEESMKRLGVTHLDYYQIWNIQQREHYEQAVAKNGIVEGMLKAKDEGLVGHLGFTTHDTVENVQSYAREADWCDTILMSYNLLDPGYAPAIRTAHEKGIGVAVMNPVGGGRLAEPSAGLTALAESVGAVSIPDMAVRYVLSNPMIDTMLIGISKPSDIDDSEASVKRGLFSEAALEKIQNRLAGMRKKLASFCTRCGYCMPCPAGIDIPAIMSCVIDARHWGWKERARRRYALISGSKADACKKCGKCEESCTQHLKIMRHMVYARRNLSA